MDHLTDQKYTENFELYQKSYFSPISCKVCEIILKYTIGYDTQFLLNNSFEDC